MAVRSHSANTSDQRTLARADMSVELVDLRDYPLPFFSEVASNLRVPSEDPEAIRWQKRIAGFDGYIFVVAEYNHSITGTHQKCA